jgi:hypothetical protein
MSGLARMLTKSNDVLATELMSLLMLTPMLPPTFSIREASIIHYLISHYDHQRYFRQQHCRRRCVRVSAYEPFPCFFDEI